MLIHSDICGPAPVSVSSGIRCFVIIVDDCTRMALLYLIKSKNEVARIFRSFHTMIKTQFSAELQILHSDNGEEYDNKELQEYFQACGLYHETICYQTPHQNDVAEKKNRHILETTWALLTAANAPLRFWTDVVTTAVYLLNRMSSRVLNFNTPLQALAHHVPLPSILMLPPKIIWMRSLCPSSQKSKNFIHMQSAAYSQAIHNIRRATDAMILQQDAFTSQWMLHF